MADALAGLALQELTNQSAALSISPEMLLLAKGIGRSPQLRGRE